MKPLFVRFTLALAVLVMSVACLPAPLAAQQAEGQGTALHAEVAPADRLEPQALVASLDQPAPPLILQVGPRTFYEQAHIRGAEYVGATSTEAGLAALRARVDGLAKDRWIVVYCGCCPWGRCPNIRPAFNQLKALGFSHVQALYLPNNFGADWVNKGYPTTK